MIRQIFSKVFETCAICLDDVIPIPFQSRKLICGHIFHKKCIEKIYLPNCPLCNTYIFNDVEKYLLRSKDKHTMKKLLVEQTQNTAIGAGRTDSSPSCVINIKQLFVYAVDHNTLLTQAMFEFCDFSQVLADNLHNFELASFILDKNDGGEISVNWFKTFNGQTLFELVYGGGISRHIRERILTKIPSYQQFHHYPQLPTAPLLDLF